MATVDLVESGLIYETSFTTLDTWWRRSPDSDICAAPSTGGLVLAPASSPTGTVMALLTLSPGCYVVEASFDYLPQYAGDEMGLVLYASEDDVVFLSVVSGGRSYSALRFCVKGERLEAWAYSDDGLWEIAGTAIVSTEALPGVYAAGQTAGTVTGLRVFRDSRIGISNLPAGSRAVIMDADDAVLSEAWANGGMASLSLPGAASSCQGRLAVYDQGGQMVAWTGLTTINGGDLYWFNAAELEVYIDGEQVYPGQELSLGYLFNRKLEKEVVLVNPQNATAGNITVQPASFIPPNSQGWVKVAPATPLGPGEYSETLFVESIEPLGQCSFWLKVERPADLPYSPFTDHHFSLIITVGSITPAG